GGAAAGTRGQPDGVRRDGVPPTAHHASELPGVHGTSVRGPWPAVLALLFPRSAGPTISCPPTTGRLPARPHPAQAGGMTTTLVTGATRGLGKETARQLVAAGHTVWVGARDEAAGRAVAAEIGARAVRLDVTDDAS